MLIQTLLQLYSLVKERCAAWGEGVPRAALTESAWPVASVGGEEEQFPVASLGGLCGVMLPPSRRGGARRGVGVLLQNDGRDVASSARGRRVSVAQRGFCPEARALPVSASSEAAEQQGVVFLDAALQKYAGISPVGLRCEKVLDDRAHRYVRDVHSRPPCD